LVVEGRLPAETVKELRRRGHIVEVESEWSEGRLTAASKDGRRRKAAANPRGMQGYAAGREASLRLPGNDLALQLLEQRRGDQPEHADGDDADEHDVDLQKLPRIPDHIADA